MAAVLAVVLLLLCSSVRSSAEEVQGTITQVKVSASPTTAPAITNTTEGSSDSHSAVLANEVLGVEDNGPLVLVDLARSDQENMTSMSAAPPTADSVPTGFDMSEPDDALPDSFAESTTPSAVAVPPGFDMNEFDAASQSLAATEDQGTLVQGFPSIGSSEDNSQGSGYGVRSYDASSATTEDDSSFAVSNEDLSLAATEDQGTLVQGFPSIGSSEDNSQGVGYGVRSSDASSATSEDDSSFAVSNEDLSLAASQDQGTLVQGFPAIGSSEDNSQGSGYGVRSYDASSATTEDDSPFAVSNEDLSLAATQDQGTLVQGFPKIGSSEDNSQGAGYGVSSYDASPATTEDDSSFTASEDGLSFAATQDQGTLVQGFPAIGSSEDNSQGSSYAVQTYDESASGGGSLSAYQEDEYPLEHEDITDGPGVGAVRPYGPFYGQP